MTRAPHETSPRSLGSKAISLHQRLESLRAPVRLSLAMPPTAPKRLNRRTSAASSHKSMPKSKDQEKPGSTRARARRTASNKSGLRVCGLCNKNEKDCIS